jgi:phosphatidylglycerophosphate synthase
MNKRSYYIVNGITLYRLMAAPLLLFLVFNGQFGLFKWLLAVSFFTDSIDGFLARHYKVASKFGAKLDSIGDDLTVIVAIIGVIVYKPGFLRQEIIVVVVLLVLVAIQTLFAFITYNKMSSFHTYLAKLAAVLQGIFLLLFFFLDGPVYILFYITAAVTAIELVEEIIIVVMLPQWETDVKGLYWVMRKQRKDQH